MNYRCPPDIDPSQPLTAARVQLFRRFKQDVDRQALEKMLNDETARHLKLCEMVILRYASCDFFWCELPQHPWFDINIWINRHLEDAGFEIEHTTEGERREVDDRENKAKQLDAVLVRNRTVASWVKISDEILSSIQAEWTRREAVEEEDLVTNPPQCISEIGNGEVRETNAVWASVLDGRYVVEVQRIHGRRYLCIFDMVTRTCRHREETTVSYDAVFGPDGLDVQQWEQRALEIVQKWQESKQA
jgi:hypothetical protein